MNRGTETTHEIHAKSAYHPLGFWRTIRFFLPWHEHRQRVASWRHFGWELEVEMGRSDYSMWLGKIEALR